MAAPAPPSGPVPLLLDVDTGIDDALALLVATRSPELELVGVGTVAGNVDVATATRNTLRVLEVAGATHVPVARGADHPLTEPPGDARWVHGDDGLGDTAQPAPAGRPSDEHAVEQLLRLSHAHAGRLVLVAVGPLTNVALALRTDPGLADRLARVVVMAGSARVGGNRHPWAEANVASDPEAAAVVLEGGLPCTMVGLDVTMQVRLSAADVDALAAEDDEVARLAAAILPCYLDVYERTHGGRWCALHDPVALLAAVRPDLVGTHRLDVRVETAGRHTRGMTVVDLRGLQAGLEVAADVTTHVALEVDAAAMRTLVLDRLRGRTS